MAGARRARPDHETSNLKLRPGPKATLVPWVAGLLRIAASADARPSGRLRPVPDGRRLGDVDKTTCSFAAGYSRQTGGIPAEDSLRSGALRPVARSGHSASLGASGGNRTRRRPVATRPLDWPRDGGRRSNPGATGGGSLPAGRSAGSASQHPEPRSGDQVVLPRGKRGSRRGTGVSSCIFVQDTRPRACVTPRLCDGLRVGALLPELMAAVSPLGPQGGDHALQQIVGPMRL